jgi:hypothetical protein
MYRIHFFLPLLLKDKNSDNIGEFKTMWRLLEWKLRKTSTLFLAIHSSLWEGLPEERKEIVCGGCRVFSDA